jgi:hypothetical protein
MTGDGLREFATGLVADWRALTADGVQFAYRDDPALIAAGLVGLTLVVLAVRLLIGRRLTREAVTVPALFGAVRTSPLAWLRHTPRVLAGRAAGAPRSGPCSPRSSPQTSVVSRAPHRPHDRRLRQHASTAFKAGTAQRARETEAAFHDGGRPSGSSSCAARAKHSDLMALIEFGDRAYVITPFTSDYDNLLLSIALIGDPIEFSMFPDPGTVIASALEQSIEVFKAFDFLEASGNLMVIFTDGEDTTSLVHGRSLDDILKSAVDNAIPLYFVRTNYGKAFGDGIPDAQWQAAVERTGGRYYIARDEQSLLNAVHDIDQAAVGAIQTGNTPAASRVLRCSRSAPPPAGSARRCSHSPCRSSRRSPEVS